jgi:predicted Zn-dependent protease
MLPFFMKYVIIYNMQRLQYPAKRNSRPEEERREQERRKLRAKRITDEETQERQILLTSDACPFPDMLSLRLGKIVLPVTVLLEDYSPREAVSGVSMAIDGMGRTLGLTRDGKRAVNSWHQDPGFDENSLPDFSLRNAHDKTGRVVAETALPIIEGWRDKHKKDDQFIMALIQNPLYSRFWQNNPLGIAWPDRQISIVSYDHTFRATQHFRSELVGNTAIHELGHLFGAASFGRPETISDGGSHCATHEMCSMKRGKDRTVGNRVDLMRSQHQFCSVCTQDMRNNLEYILHPKRNL